jgi:hypothetical protein
MQTHADFCSADFYPVKCKAYLTVMAEQKMQSLREKYLYF